MTSSHVEEITSDLAPIDSRPAEPQVGPGTRRGQSAPESTSARIAALTALVAAVSALGALLLPDGELKLALLILFSLVGPGAAIASFVKLRETWASFAVTLTGSLTISALLPTLMIWLGWWYPTPMLVALALVTSGSAIFVLMTTPSARSSQHEVELPDSADRSVDAGSGTGAFGSNVRRCASFVPLAIALACWTFSLLTADPLNGNSLGLTATLGPAFVVAIVLTGSAFVIELSGRTRPWVLGLMTFVFVLMLRGSVPLIVSTPEYAWTYKHFGVVDALDAAGQVVNSQDIFQQWPAFFAYFAQVSHIAGVDPENIGAWSSFVFCIIDGILVYALARTIRASTRVAFLTAFTFEAAFWPDTNYFSPQAFAYALSLGFLFILLRWFVRPPVLNADSRNVLARRLSKYDLTTGSVGYEAMTPGARFAAVGALAGVFFVITAAHQLSPYILLLGVSALMVFGLIRPRWLIILLAAVALGYFVPRFGDVTSQYKILNTLNIFANASGNGIDANPSTAQLVSTLAARVLTFALWGSVAVVALVAFQRKTLGMYTIPLVLGFSPFGILLAGNYGGEAIYRVFIFSMPWFCFLIAHAFGRVVRRRMRYTISWSIVLVVTALLALQGAQGQFSFNVISQSDVDASRYFYENAPAGSSLTLAAQVFPTRITAEYGQINPTLTTEPTLLDDQSLINRPWDASALPIIEQQVRQWPGTAHFLVVSNRMKAYVTYFGLLDPSSIDSVQQELRLSTDWTVWYSDGDTTIFKLGDSQ